MKQKKKLVHITTIRLKKASPPLPLFDMSPPIRIQISLLRRRTEPAADNQSEQKEQANINSH